MSASTASRSLLANLLDVLLSGNAYSLKCRITFGYLAPGADSPGVGRGLASGESGANNWSTGDDGAGYQLGDGGLGTAPPDRDPRFAPWARLATIANPDTAK